MTLNSKDSKELCQLAFEHKVNLMVGHLLLFHPAFNKIKSMVDEGLIGDLQYMYSNRLNFGTIRSDENVFGVLLLTTFLYFNIIQAVTLKKYSQ